MSSKRNVVNIGYTGESDQMALYLKDNAVNFKKRTVKFNHDSIAVRSEITLLNNEQVYVKKFLNGSFITWSYENTKAMYEHMNIIDRRVLIEKIGNSI